MLANGLTPAPKPTENDTSFYIWQKGLNGFGYQNATNPECLANLHFQLHELTTWHSSVVYHVASWPLAHGSTCCHSACMLRAVHATNVRIAASCQPASCMLPCYMLHDAGLAPKYTVICVVCGCLLIVARSHDALCTGVKHLVWKRHFSNMLTSSNAQLVIMFWEVGQKGSHCWEIC